MTIWETPHGRDFMMDIRRRLEGKNCFCIIPDHFRPYFLPAFGKFMKMTGKNISIVENDNASEKDIMKFFPESDSMGSGPFGGVICLQHGKGAREFLKACVGKKWHCLCVAGPGATIPKGFMPFYWWGKAGLSDFIYAIESELQKRQFDLPVVPWHNAMCQALCPLDTRLCGQVMDAAPVSPDEVCEFLMKHKFYAKETGVLVQGLFRNHLKTLYSGKTPKSGAAFELWKAGCLDFSYGQVHVHPAALLAAGLTRDVKRLVVDGQKRVYLPLTTEIHAALCRRMQKMHGNSWHERTFESDAHTREISPLCCYLRRHFNREEADSVRLASLWGDVRHCLAHSDFMPMQLAVKAMLAWQKFYQEN